MLDRFAGWGVMMTASVTSSWQVHPGRRGPPRRRAKWSSRGWLTVAKAGASRLFTARGEGFSCRAHSLDGVQRNPPPRGAPWKEDRRAATQPRSIAPLLLTKWIALSRARSDPAEAFAARPGLFGKRMKWVDAEFSFHGHIPHCSYAP